MRINDKNDVDDLLFMAIGILVRVYLHQTQATYKRERVHRTIYITMNSPKMGIRQIKQIEEEREREEEVDYVCSRKWYDIDSHRSKHVSIGIERIQFAVHCTPLNTF